MSNATQILIIDDDPSIHEVMSELLSLHGYQVRSAATGREGLALAGNLHPALVLLDVRLPDLSGHEVCRQIKTNPALHDVFVVLISGEATDTLTKVEGLEVGADEYLTKPIGGPEFLARIRTLLRLRNALAAHRASEAALRLFLDAISELALMVDRKGTVLFANRSMARTLGHSMDAITGRQAFDLFPPDIAQARKGQFDQVVRTGQAMQFEDEHGTRHFLNYLEPVLDPRGKVSCVALLALDITDRKRAELEIFQLNETLEQRVRERTLQLEAANEALRVSEARYRRLHETMSDAFVSVDMQGRILECNRAYQEMTGHTAEELKRLNYQDLTPEKWHAIEARIVAEQILPKGYSQIYEKEYRRKDGRIFPVEVHRLLLKDNAGQPAAMWAIIRDITERKRAEYEIRKLNQDLEQRVKERTAELLLANESLRMSEGRLKRTARAGNVGLWDWDLQIDQVFYSAEWKRQIGFEEHEISNGFGEWQNRVHEEDIATTLEKIRAVLSKATALFEAEFRFRHKDGSYRWILAHGSLLCDHDGKPQHMMGSHVDITELKLAQVVLRESEEKFRALFESAPIGIALHDASGHYLHANPGYQQMLGYTYEELQRLEVKGVTFADDVAKGRRLFAQLREGTRDSYHHDKRYLSKDGRLIWAESSASAVRDQRGQLRFIISMVEDITGRKQAEDQIRLLANAVHSTQELICIMDQENRFQFVNRGFLKAYGYGEQELLGRQPDFLYAPVNSPGLCQQVFQQTLEGGWQGEIVHRRKDGTEFPIALNTSQIKDGAGRILGLVGVARDISSQKRDEKQNTALSLLGHRLSAAATAEQAANIIMETASELFGWDAGYVHLYSRTDDKIIPVLTVDTVEGRRVPIPPENFTLDPSPLMRAILLEGSRLINRAGDSAAPVNLVAFGDVQRRSSSMMYVPIHSSADNVGILSIQSYAPSKYSEIDLQLLQTLADHCGEALLRIEVTEARRIAEAKYQRIFEEATEGIVQTTLEDRYRSANPAAARMLGYETPEELISSVTNIGRQTYVVPERQKELRRLLETQASVEGFEAERYCKDGRKIWTNINGHVVRDAGGALLHYEVTYQDITGRKLAEEELRRLPKRIIEAQEAERLRVARELHDGVNQLLASAKMRLRNVEECLIGFSPAAREILHRCNRLLGQALEENRRIAHDLRPSDLDELGLAEACRNLCKEFRSRTSLLVKSRFPGDWQRQPPAVELNLFRIVQEALTNVEKHAQAKTVRLRLAIEGKVVLLSIRDDGRGFDSSGPTTAGKRKRGIGLTNLRERAASMGGTCEVVSAPRKGTTITVRVPLTNAK